MADRYTGVVRLAVEGAFPKPLSAQSVLDQDMPELPETEVVVTESHLVMKEGENLA